MKRAFARILRNQATLHERCLIEGIWAALRARTSQDARH